MPQYGNGSGGSGYFDDPIKHRDRTRAQAVFIRGADQACAMSWMERAKAHTRGLFGKRTSPEAESRLEAEVSDFPATTKPAVQYRLAATHRAPKRSWLVRFLCCCGLFGSQRQRQGLSVGVNNNQQLAVYLHWMFRVNFIFLFMTMCMFFFALVILFSGFIALAGTMNAECVRIGGFKFAHAGTPFADAFALSWTTFSTVGYGSAYPALGFQNTDGANCFFVNFICSLESLLGILYAGFCGAVLFGKVLRIQSQAQVIFSDPVLIRYGPGLADLTGSVDDPEQTSPCPVLEFRIVNRLFNELGGEIMDANLNVVANIDADDADPSIRSAMDSERSTVSSHTTPDESTSETSEASTGRSEHSMGVRQLSNILTPVLTSLVKHKDHHVVDDDPTSRLVSKHVFSKMLIEASDHPFFKRVWLARHVLDQHSPILKPKVRKQIRRNGGKWPERLNSHAAIRDSLQFNQILVSLNGVSNVSASDVYAQRIYDYVDVSIGYQFVNILYRDTDGQLGVDIDLINDVREQVGGGGEPLMLD